MSEKTSNYVTKITREIKQVKKSLKRVRTYIHDCARDDKVSVEDKWTLFATYSQKREVKRKELKKSKLLEIIDSISETNVSIGGVSFELMYAILNKMMDEGELERIDYVKLIKEMILLDFGFVKFEQKLPEQSVQIVEKDGEEVIEIDADNISDDVKTENNEGDIQ